MENLAKAMEKIELPILNDLERVIGFFLKNKERIMQRAEKTLSLEQREQLKNFFSLF